MTKQMHDTDMAGISGGGSTEHLFPRLSRILSMRARRAGATAPAPGGPGPGPEAQSDSGGIDSLTK